MQKKIMLDTFLRTKVRYLICILLPKFVMLYKMPFILSCNKWYVLKYTTDTNVYANTQYISLEVHHSNFWKQHTIQFFTNIYYFPFTSSVITSFVNSHLTLITACIGAYVYGFLKDLLTLSLGYLR